MADPVLVTSSGGLGANASIAWSRLGASFTTYASPITECDRQLDGRRPRSPRPERFDLFAITAEIKVFGSNNVLLGDFTEFSAQLF